MNKWCVPVVQLYMNELFQIPNHPDYFATKDGRIWSTKRIKGKWLKQSRRSSIGHLAVRLYVNQHGRMCGVHRLILETFVGPCPDGMECRHLDGNPTNNNLSNLKWGTHSENVQDSIRHGTYAHGETFPRHKLIEKDVRMIILLYKTGWFSQKEIAQIYSISQSNIKVIVNKKTWKHLWRSIRLRIMLGSK